MKIPMFALQHGAATGAIIILLKLVGYLLGVEAMMSGWSGFGQMVFVVAGMFVAVAATRNAEEGWITFGRAFGVALLTAAVATLLALLMDIILGTLIDPGLSEKLMRLTREELDSSGFFMLLSKEDTEQFMSELKWAMKPMGQCVSWLLGLIFWSGVALIVGAITKRNDPQKF